MAINIEQLRRSKRLQSRQTWIALYAMRGCL